MGTVEKEEKEFDPDEEARQERIARMPILEQCYNLMDFESVARRVMKKTAWAYYSSGADDEIVRQALPVFKIDATADISRPCEKTIPPFIRYGSDQRFLWMWKRSILLQLCLERKSIFLSM